MAQKIVTLRDIAERVSLSRMAVSLALRGLPSVPPKTQERVWAAARELGYRPDPVVKQALRTLRASYHKRNPIVVALVTHGGNDQWRRHSTLRSYAAGIGRRAEEMGFDLQTFERRRDGMRDERLSDIMTARGIRHLIVAPLPEHRVGETIGFAWERFCSVAIARSLLSPELHRVCADHFASALMAYAKIVEKGYRRIGLAIDSEIDRRSGGRWRGGFLVAEAEHGLPQIPPLVGDALEKTAFLKWLDAWSPDAIITQGTHVLPWLREAGVRVPRDVAVCCTSLLPGEPDMPDAGICETFEAVGAAAVNLIAGEVIGREVGLPRHPVNIGIVGEWVDGSMMPGKPVRVTRKRVQSTALGS